MLSRVGFILDAPSVVVGFTRWVHTGSLGSLRFDLAVVGVHSCVIRGRLDHSGAHWVTLGSCRVVGFTQVRTGCRWVNQGSLGSDLAFGLIQGHWKSLEIALGIVGLIWGRWVHSVNPEIVGFIRRVSLGSFGVVLFTRMSPGGCWVPPGSSGIFEFTPVRPGGRCVHPGSLGSFTCDLGVVGFILGCLFTLVRSGGGRVHPGHPGSLGSLGCADGFLWVRFCSLGCALGVVGFILGCWVH